MMLETKPAMIIIAEITPNIPGCEDSFVYNKQHSCTSNCLSIFSPIAVQLVYVYWQNQHKMNTILDCRRNTNVEISPSHSKLMRVMITDEDIMFAWKKKSC